MRQQSPVGMTVVKSSEKQEKIRNFILQAIAASHRNGDTVANGTLLLIARSAESPVAQALVSLGAEIAEAGLAIRAIFSDIDAEGTSAGWTVNGMAIPFQRDVRWAKNLRLSDAHEQLVLSNVTCWVGDCMRRDPSKVDAFELHASEQPETTRFASVSFERIWAHAEPLAIRTSQRGLDTLAASIPEAGQIASLTPADGAQVVASTRH